MTDRSSRRSPVLRAALAAVLMAGGCQGTVPVASQSATRSPGDAPASSSSAVTSAPPSVALSAAPSVGPSRSSSSAVSLVRFGPLPTKALSSETSAALQAILDLAVKDGAPDVIAALITADGVWAGASGVGGPDGREATADDEFAIGSVSTTFIAALVMRLVEHGKIRLDAPLADYLGDVKIDTNGATVRQALGHRTGIPDIDGSVGQAIAADPAHRWTLEDTLAVLPPPNGPPGPYASALSNYVMLGLAVEHVTGMSVAKALRKEVLDPVGATRILDQGAGVPTPKPWALPTEDHLGAFKLTDLGAGDAISCIASATASHGVGGLAGDAPSLAAWAWHLFAGDVIGDESRLVMLPGPDGHGKGLDVLDAPLDAALGMTGSKTGYGTVLAIVPTDRIVAVVLVNDESFRIDPYVARLIAAAAGG